MRRVDSLLRQRGSRAEQIEILMELMVQRSSDAPPVELTDGRRECKECYKLFRPTRSDARYCSGRCRVRSLRARKCVVTNT